MKFRTQSILGFKTFYNARRVLIGIELMQKIVKGQFRAVPLNLAALLVRFGKPSSPLDCNCSLLQQGPLGHSGFLYLIAVGNRSGSRTIESV
jgi:hypothetical protein